MLSCADPLRTPQVRNRLRAITRSDLHFGSTYPRGGVTRVQGDRRVPSHQRGLAVSRGKLDHRDRPREIGIERIHGAQALKEHTRWLDLPLAVEDVRRARNGVELIRGVTAQVSERGRTLGPVLHPIGKWIVAELNRRAHRQYP